MPEELQGAPADSPQPETQAASSPAEQHQPVIQSPEPGTPPTTQTGQPDWNLPPQQRWDQLRQERQEAMERAARAEAMAQMALQATQAQQQPKSPMAEYWAGKIDHPEPTTRAFWQEQKMRDDLLMQQIQGLTQVVDAGRKELAEVKVENFQLRHQDIDPNSAEYQAIAGYVQQGYPLPAARKLALFDRQESELKALRSKQSSVGQKVAANMTAPTSSIPSTSGLPGQPGNWRDNVRQAMKKGGSLADIVNAAGASRASTDSS